MLGDRIDHVPPLEKVELIDLGAEVVVGRPAHEPWEEPPSSYQRIRIADGVIVSIRDYETRAAALAGEGPPS